ncbi:transposase [Cohnella cholangitidis]|uniref:Transposase n=1 Tax=Cohnella cholangitidis TaxID=2598458 RepID=A0A7G5BXQ6_9BACL|nr:transposase [Cohnella cholangitidis]QMV41740.1 transposase [Cohnella cholangitidis]
MSSRLDAAAFDAFCRQYDNESDCISALFKAKWPNGFRCPGCQSPHAYLISTRRLPLYECYSCKKQTSLITGTVMEGSRTPLRLWFQAIHLHARAKSVNALQLSHLLKVTYKTAWLICHKIRFAMRQADSAILLKGIVRVTDAICYKRLTSTFELHKQEQPILIGASDAEDGNIGYLKIEHQSKSSLRDKYDRPDPQPFISKHVDPRSLENVIITRRYGRTMNKTLVWESLYLSSWLGKLFRGIGPKHLQAYIHQYCYYSNNLLEGRFTKLLLDCSVSHAITYPALIGRSATLRSLKRTRFVRKSQEAM